MEQYGFLVPLVLFVSIFGFLGYRYFRYGGFLGMIVGARVMRTVGSVQSEKTLGISKRLKVHVLERELGQGVHVALGETASTWGAIEFRATKLSAEEARQLARLLDEAAAG